jgi:periplasmic copper chaperone A
MVRVVLLAALLVAATPAVAQNAGNLQIDGAWARATPKGAQVGGGYLTITNKGASPDRLIGGSTPAAAKLEVHQTSMSGGVAHMREHDKGLVIKPGQKIEFKPGGNHVMFVNLKEPLVQGRPITATLEFEKAGKVEVQFRVEPVGSPGPAAHGH